MKVIHVRFLLVVLGAAIVAASSFFPEYAKAMQLIGTSLGSIAVPAEAVHAALGGVKDVAKVVPILFLLATSLLWSCSELHPLDPADVRVDCDKLVSKLDEGRDAGLSCEEARLNAYLTGPRCKVVVICRINLDGGYDGGLAE